MLDMARKYKRVVQVGAQQRSGEHYKAAIDLIRSGALGGVHKISATWVRNMNPGFAPTELKSGLTRNSIGICGLDLRDLCPSSHFALCITGAGSGTTRAAR